MDPDSDPDPAIFVIDLQEANKSIISHKTVGITVFLTIFAWSESSRNCQVIASSMQQKQNQTSFWAKRRARFHDAKPPNLPEDKF
jgi:hypothetical protein